jgi:preprotein translocase subunit SecG
MTTFFAYALMTLHMFLGIFLIGLILLQRGRGGGLAGSLGGMGGQSAFGTKAGDIFTKVTIGVAVAWILLACVCIIVVNMAATASGRAKFVTKDGDKAVISAPAVDGEKDGKGKVIEGLGNGKKEEDSTESEGTSDEKPPVKKDGPVGADKKEEPAAKTSDSKSSEPVKEGEPEKKADAEKKPEDETSDKPDASTSEKSDAEKSDAGKKE